MYFNLLVCVFRIEVPDLVHVTIGEDEHMLAMNKDGTFHKLVEIV